MKDYFGPTVNFFATLGITARSRLFNVRSLIAIMIFGTLDISFVAYIFCEAKGFKDYTESIYVASVGIGLFSSFFIFIWKSENIFKFIDCWEKIVDTSK